MTIYSKIETQLIMTRKPEMHADTEWSRPRGHHVLPIFFEIDCFIFFWNDDKRENQIKRIKSIYYLTKKKRKDKKIK